MVSTSFLFYVTGNSEREATNYSDQCWDLDKNYQFLVISSRLKSEVCYVQGFC